ncbi:MAG: vitamin B12-dependent ribonucleotide reductase [Deltaproteobacteria bacterium]|nr:vitamin B12-dependent ribonucleotide reductase [Deltaproteobacteria bacterium]
MRLGDNAMRVLERRYLRKNADGEVMETPEEMFARVAHTVAKAEELYGHSDMVDEIERRFYDLMTSLQFIPNSPTLMNAGRELGQLSACFVLPVGDSMDSIFEAIKHTALIHKSGGGTGFSFSRIRPRNDTVASTKGVSSGPLSFMRVFDIATETIKQGGTRRGANMGILSVTHPDVLDFISSKTEQRNFNNFNISVAVTDDFMKAAEADAEYDLTNPRSGVIAKRLRAKKVLDAIVMQAWKNGEPGVIFIDRINAENPTPQMGRIESTNPCGEQPLLPYESCNLGSLNLAVMVREGQIDSEKLRSAVHGAVHFLDNVIDANRYPLPEIEKMTRGNRKIGLGVMGFADMLIKMGVPYDSEEALQIGEEVMAFIDEESKKASEALSAERGTFPNFPGSIYDREGGRRLRNATTTTIAPTGTISIIAGVSSGIEPIFAVSYVRNVMDKDELPEANPIFSKMAREGGFYSDELMREIARKGTVQDVEGVPARVRRLFRCAHDIAPEWHVRMQATFQKHTDNAVSKTVNLPHDARPEDVGRIYWLAYRLGTKGITVYRDGSRDEQVLSVQKDKIAQAGAAHEETEELKIVPRERPEVISGTTQKLTTGCGNLYVTINEDETGPFELFTAMGKAGGCASSQAEAISRLISLSLRAGLDIELIIKQLQGVRCPNPAWMNGELILSCADAIARSMRQYVEMRAKQGKTVAARPALEKAEKSREQKAVPAKISHALSGEKIVSVCPDCGGHIEQQEGCLLCRSCGYSKCG